MAPKSAGQGRWIGAGSLCIKHRISVMWPTSDGNAVSRKKGRKIGAGGERLREGQRVRYVADFGPRLGSSWRAQKDVRHNHAEAGETFQCSCRWSKAGGKVVCPGRAGGPDPISTIRIRYIMEYFIYN